MSKYSSYIIGEAEAHLNGMLEAAEICNRYLRDDVAELIRSAVTIRRATGLASGASQKPAEVGLWSGRYVDAVRRLEGGRAAFKAEQALSAFGTLDEFLGATDEQLLAAPQCGPAILLVLKRVRDEV